MIGGSVLIWSVGQWVGGSVFSGRGVGRRPVGGSVVGGLVVDGRWFSGDPVGVSVVGCPWSEFL